MTFCLHASRSGNYTGVKVRSGNAGERGYIRKAAVVRVEVGGAGEGEQENAWSRREKHCERI
ncbi:hypothetical protein E2C01_089180 [Portunus trituberculatus]|uniref:Uncharacterized protein n=1 Tax=Portunus trituberculatus TaxID=210409 RepID=A0A5B7JGJ7_PORTR|nr:hypothetical protein [Portunus trituberculatus]